MHPFCYQDIDCTLLWQRALQKKSWISKGQNNWDKQDLPLPAETGSRPTPRLLVSASSPKPTGPSLISASSPNTLALPLAAQVRFVSCLVFPS